MYKIKTRLPLTAWVLAALVTLSSLLSTLIHQDHPSNHQATTDVAQIAPLGASGNDSAITASVH